MIEKASLIFIFSTISFATNMNYTEESKSNLHPSAFEISKACQNDDIYNCLDLYIRSKANSSNIDTNNTHNQSFISAIYNDVYSQFTDGQKKYLSQNYKLICRITNATLNRYAPNRIPSNISSNGQNTIQFYLHPDGSISDIFFIQKSKIDIFNDTTKETIEIAYFKYPRPTEKILIRYRVSYNLLLNNIQTNQIQNK